MTLLFTLAVFPLAASQTNSGKQNFPLNPCIIDTLRARGNFVVLLRGLEAAGLDKTIRQSKAVTIFAPNDAAFAKLPHEALESLMKEPGGMKQLLANHILLGRVSLKQMVAGKFSSVTNLTGAAILQIYVSCDAEGCLLGAEKEARVVNDDLVGSNGLIIETDHVMFRPIFNPPSRW